MDPRIRLKQKIPTRRKKSERTFSKPIKGILTKNQIELLGDLECLVLGRNGIAKSGESILCSLKN